MFDKELWLAQEGLKICDLSKQLMVMTFGSGNKNVLREKEDGSLEFTGDVNKAARLMFINLSALHSKFISESKSEIDLLKDKLRQSEDALCAAKLVLREALDDVRVHPCDEHNDEARSRGLSSEMLALYKAMK